MFSLIIDIYPVVYNNIIVGIYLYVESGPDSKLLDNFEPLFLG